MFGDFFAQWWDSENPWEQAMEHTLWLLTVIGVLVGAVKGVKVWRRAQVEAAESRVRREDSLTRVLHHLDNGGSKLVDKVDAGNRLLAAHVESADEQFALNAQQHVELHRRIDGLFELIAGRGQTEPRRMADRHNNRRTAEDEEG